MLPPPPSSTYNDSDAGSAAYEQLRPQRSRSLRLSSSSSAAAAAPRCHPSPISASAVPFSWERRPGIPKAPRPLVAGSTARPLLPPPLRSSSLRINDALDPFAAALAECAKSPPGPDTRDLCWGIDCVKHEKPVYRLRATTSHNRSGRLKATIYRRFPPQDPCNTKNSFLSYLSRSYLEYEVTFDACPSFSRQQPLRRISAWSGCPRLQGIHTNEYSEKMITSDRASDRREVIFNGLAWLGGEEGWEEALFSFWLSRPNMHGNHCPYKRKSLKYFLCMHAAA